MLAPNFVIWAFLLGAILTISGGMLWLGWHDRVAWLLRRAHIGDTVAAWLLYGAIYHTWWLAVGRGGLLDGPWAALALWGVLVLYTVLRATSLARTRPNLLLALVLICWAWAIGAGFDYVSAMERDAARLERDVGALLSAEGPALRPLERGLVLTRLQADDRQLTRRVVTLRRAGAALDVVDVTLMRLEGIPALRREYARDLAKLRTYQWVQVGLLAVVMLLWGFGRLPGQE